MWLVRNSVIIKGTKVKVSKQSEIIKGKGAKRDFVTISKVKVLKERLCAIIKGKGTKRASMATLKAKKKYFLASTCSKKRFGWAK